MSVHFEKVEEFKFANSQSGRPQGSCRVTSGSSGVVNDENLRGQKNGDVLVTVVGRWLVGLWLLVTPSCCRSLLVIIGWSDFQR